MKQRSGWLWLTLAVVIGLGAWYTYAFVSRHQIAARHVPPPPTFTDRPPVLAASIADAETRARSWGKAKDGLIELSRLYHANGFYPEAMRCYDGLQRMEPRNPRWLHLQASIIANYGQLEAALPLRRAVVDLAPDYIAGRLRLADVLLKTNRIADATAVYSDVLGKAPGNPYALLGLARCDLANQNWEKAKAHLQESLAQNPNFVGGLSLLVSVSEHLGDFATADGARTAMAGGVFTDLPDPWLDELSDVCYDAYLLSVAASVANFAGDRTVAMSLINRAIALSPEAISYRRQAGQYLLQDGKFADAKVQLEKALAVNPTDSDCWLRYLDALRGLGQTQAAVNAMLTGLSHCPQSSALHLDYARWLKSVNRLDESIAEFKRGHELRPTEASPLVELATTYLTAGRSAEALDALNQALVRQPDHPTALTTLALIHINNGQEPEARSRFEQVRRQGKITPDLLGRLRQSFQQQFGRDP